MYEAWGYAFHRLKLDLKRKRSVYYWWKFRLTIAIRSDLIEFVTQVHYFCWNFFHSNQLIMFHFSLLIIHFLMHIVRLLNAVTMSLFADALIYLIHDLAWFPETQSAPIAWPKIWFQWMFSWLRSQKKVRKQRQLFFCLAFILQIFEKYIPRWIALRHTPAFGKLYAEAISNNFFKKI